jgi:hypothetical protein
MKFTKRLSLILSITAVVVSICAVSLILLRMHSKYDQLKRIESVYSADQKILRSNKPRNKKYRSGGIPVYDPLAVEETIKQ